MVGPARESAERHVVVLVHGLLATTVVMRSLAHSLSGVFSGVVNWGYQSLWSPIERHGRQLSRRAAAARSGGAHDQIHLVTHSMGGIIGRIALAEYMPLRFGRFVMIAPPNRGSHVAARLRRTGADLPAAGPAYRWQRELRLLAPAADGRRTGDYRRRRRFFSPRAQHAPGLRTGPYRAARPPFVAALATRNG